MTQCWAVVPAAGVGRRMGADVPKQYLEIGGAALIAHVLDCLCSHPRIGAVAVAVASGDERWAALRARWGARVVEAAGGRERGDSVLGGLAALAGRASGDDWVMVHDAARPCIRASDVDRLLDAVGGHPDGGLLATPVADTVKRAAADGTVERTVERTGLWRALTPQVFRYRALTEALEQAIASGVTVTDEAQAMELAGAHPLLVEGRAGNIKVTGPHDLRLAALLIGAEGEGT